MKLPNLCIIHIFFSAAQKFTADVCEFKTSFPWEHLSHYGEYVEDDTAANVRDEFSLGVTILDGATTLDFPITCRELYESPEVPNVMIMIQKTLIGVAYKPVE